LESEASKQTYQLSSGIISFRVICFNQQKVEVSLTVFQKLAGLLVTKMYIVHTGHC